MGRHSTEAEYPIACVHPVIFAGALGHGGRHRLNNRIISRVKALHRSGLKPDAIAAVIRNTQNIDDMRWDTVVAILKDECLPSFEPAIRTHRCPSCGGKIVSRKCIACELFPERTRR